MNFSDMSAILKESEKYSQVPAKSQFYFASKMRRFVTLGLPPICLMVGSLGIIR